MTCNLCEDGYFMLQLTDVDQIFNEQVEQTFDDLQDHQMSAIRSASVCRKCNQNCACSNGSVLCERCLDDQRFYYNPVTKACQSCASQNQTDPNFECEICSPIYNNTVLKKMLCLKCRSEGVISIPEAIFENETSQVQTYRCVK